MKTQEHRKLMLLYLVSNGPGSKGERRSNPRSGWEILSTCTRTQKPRCYESHSDHEPVSETDEPKAEVKRLGTDNRKFNKGEMIVRLNLLSHFFILEPGQPPDQEYVPARHVRSPSIQK
jgi:hypothetical protein